jgi:hypothetical protein
MKIVGIYTVGEYQFPPQLRANPLAEGDDEYFEHVTLSEAEFKHLMKLRAAAAQYVRLCWYLRLNRQRPPLSTKHHE